MSLFYETIDITHFYCELVRMDSIQKELKSFLGDSESVRIINDFMMGIPYDQIEGNYEDIIGDYIENNAVEIETLYGMGSYGEFPISILNYGPLFWVQAQEFDSIKFFKSKEDAVSCAEWEYEAYLNSSGDD
jgi:hypothetical protein